MESNASSPATARPESPTPVAIAAFIARWQHASGTERANYQLFLTELCELLALPRPEPARDGHEDNAMLRARAAKVAEVLDTLVALGQARRDGAGGYAA